MHRIIKNYLFNQFRNFQKLERIPKISGDEVKDSVPRSFLRKVRSHLGEPARLTRSAHLHMNSLSEIHFYFPVKDYSPEIPIGVVKPHLNV